MRPVRALGALAMVVALAGSATPAPAQMELAVIQGTVKDDAGQPLEGVRVVLKDATRGRDTELKTDKAGKFYRRGLPAVEYEIAVEKPGYNPIHDSLKLNAGLEKRYDFKLTRAAPEGAEEFAQGVAAFNRGDAAAAAAAFEASLAKAPNLPEVRVNLALAYVKLSRVSDAIAQLQQARALAPDKPTVLFQLGEAYIEVKDYDKAVAAIEEGLRKSPSRADPIALEGMVTLGAVHFAKGDNDTAIVQFEKVLAIKDQPAARLGLAKAYFSKGDVDKALQQLRQVVASAPGTREAAEADTFIKELTKGKP